MSPDVIVLLGVCAVLSLLISALLALRRAFVHSGKLQHVARVYIAISCSSGAEMSPDVTMMFGGCAWLSLINALFL